MSQRLDMLEKLITKGSADPFVHYARAMELRTLGRGVDALAAFRDLRQRFPGYVPQYLMAGQLATELGDPALARDFLEEGQRQATSSGDSHALSEIASALASLPG